MVWWDYQVAVLRLGERYWGVLVLGLVAGVGGEWDWGLLVVRGEWRGLDTFKYVIS